MGLDYTLRHNEMIVFIKTIMLLFVNKEYNALEQMSKGNRMDSYSLEYAITEYGGTVIMPPENFFYSLSIVQIDTTQGESWSVYIPFWTEEEGESDLTLDLTVSALDGRFEVEINNIHVL